MKKEKLDKCLNYWGVSAENNYTCLLADIAYQLTRIADQGEPTRIVFADKPAPDAGLADAVRNFLNAEISDNAMIEHRARNALQSALATYEKEAAHKPEVE